MAKTRNSGKISGPLSDTDLKITGEALQGALLDLIDLSLQSKQAHWNLTGPHFRSLHLQLDEVVALARKHMDRVAERSIAIGANPDGRAETVAKVPSKQISAGYLKDTEVVTSFVALLAGIIERFRHRISDTADPDPVTQDLLIEVSQDLEQQHWMFEAQKP